MAEMKVLSHEADSLQGDLHAHVSSRKEKYTRLARKILREVQDEHNKKQSLDLTVSTYALFGMMNWIYNWYDPTGKLSVSDLAQNLTQLFLGGFLTESSKSRINFVFEKRPAEGLSVWRGGHPGKPLKVR
jgi:TetR/AcrR family transcriptional regulator, cholesterol catabolism regulator